MRNNPPYLMKNNPPNNPPLLLHLHLHLQLQPLTTAARPPPLGAGRSAFLAQKGLL